MFKIGSIESIFRGIAMFTFFFTFYSVVAYIVFIFKPVFNVLFAKQLKQKDKTMEGLLYDFFAHITINIFGIKVMYDKVVFI